jgi:electron transport complex protein RnfG
MRKEMIRLGATLLVVGLIAAVGLGLTYTVTEKKIAEQDRLSVAKASVEALPGVKRKVVPDVQKVYSTDKGTIFNITTKGYGGPLSLAVGIDPQGKVAGIAVISNKETIGLGSKALEASFLNRFKGKSKADPLEVGKDIQGITGATITSKAVTNQAKQALKAYAASR